MSSESIWDRLQTIDRRIFYWILFIALMIPFIRPLSLPIALTPTTRGLYDELAKVQPGDVCLLSINSGVSAWPDCLPAMVASVKMLVRQEAKIIVWGMGHVDVDITWNKIVSKVPELETYTYGEDYAYFGYLPTQETTIALLASNIRGVFTLDKYGNPIDSLRIMEGVNTAEDFRVALSSDTGDIGDYYVRQWHTNYRTPVAEIGIAMLGSSYMPYFLSGDIFGMTVGSRGGAELEKLVGAPGDGTITMDAINVSHILVVIAVILANVGYFATRRSR
jgi:hypothetical protein